MYVHMTFVEFNRPILQSKVISVQEFLVRFFIQLNISGKLETKMETFAFNFPILYSLFLLYSVCRFSPTNTLPFKSDFVNTRQCL